MVFASTEKSEQKLANTIRPIEHLQLEKYIKVSEFFSVLTLQRLSQCHEFTEKNKMSNYLCKINKKENKL